MPEMNQDTQEFDSENQPEPQGPVNPLQDELDTLRSEMALLKTEALRERADLENQRKRVARDVEQARGQPVAALRRRDEHLAQRHPALADVDQRHRTDDGVAVVGHPEFAVAASVEPGHVEQVRLVLATDRQAEFAALDAENQRQQGFGVGRGVRADFNHRG